MLRGVNRNVIFFCDKDRERFVKILRKVTSCFKVAGELYPPYCHIHAYCLMDNHVHLLIAEGSESISAIMRRISVAYVMYLNNRYLRVGTPFQGRFQSEPVCDKDYFVKLLRYIHHNPIKAEMVSSLDDYPWSSWHEYKNVMADVDVCTHKLPYGNLSWAEICRLVRENCEHMLPNTPIDSQRMSDREAVAVLDSLCQGKSIKDFSKAERKKIISQALSLGVMKLQLARITEIPYSTIVYQSKKK
ncbi:MAG: transposase [Bacteroidales bacterium]|nr:transposase [Bacteroidales bacterium]